MNKENVSGKEKTENGEKDNIEVNSLSNTTLTCPTAVLAAQLRKIVPSANITNRKSSISMLEESFPESKKASNSCLKKHVTFSILPKISLTSEIAMEELLKADDEAQLLENAETEDLIRSFPVPLEEKRMRRSSIMIARRKPWNVKVKECFKRAAKRLQQMKPWHEDLKLIEGRFGASVVAYFVFIRWLLLMNIIILSLNFFFLVLPQYTFTPLKVTIEANISFNETVTADFSFTQRLRKKASNIERKGMQDEGYNEDFADSEWPQFEAFDEATLSHANSSIDLIKYCHSRYLTQVENATSDGFFVQIQHLLQGTGPLERTLLFIGSFPLEDISFLGHIYHMPLAVIWVFIVCFVISLLMMTQYASFGIQEAFVTHQNFHNFSNEIFCGWDYCIKTPKAAEIHCEKFVNGLKSTLSEIRRRKELGKRTSAEWIKIYFRRIIVNIIVFMFIVVCYIIIYKVALYQLQAWKTNQLEEAGFRTFLIQYLPSITIIVISFISPFVFDFLVAFEKYHGQNEVNISLMRNSFLSLSSIIVLVSTFHQQITCKPRSICGAGRSYDCRTPRCWETYVGQQLYKLSLTQLFCIIGIFLFVDIPRNYIATKYNNKYTRLLGRPPFFLPTEVIEPIYAQSVLWLGVFYSPMLPAIIVFMLLVLFYLKKAKVLKYSEPSKAVYKASRFNSAFMTILIFSYLVILTVHMYTLVRIRPSLGCSPFRIYNSMIEALRQAFQFLPFDLITVFTYIFSGWFFVLASILMCVVIYYYWKYIDFLSSLELSLKKDLLIQSQDKQFLLKKIAEMTKKSE